MTGTEFVPAYDAYLKYDRTIGDAGMPMLIVGAIPIHDILINSNYSIAFLSKFRYHRTSVGNMKKYQIKYVSCFT